MTIKKRRIYQLANLAGLDHESALSAIKRIWPKYKSIHNQISIGKIKFIDFIFQDLGAKKLINYNIDKPNIATDIHDAIHKQHKTDMSWQRAEPTKKKKNQPSNREIKNLTNDEITIKLLQRLYKNGKTGRNHTTPLENLYGHGIPDHQKQIAKDLIDNLLSCGMLSEKQSQGRRHIWITQHGLNHLRKSSLENNHQN